MAITGSGTQGDPYIVHSYQEIKSCVAGINISGSYGPWYISLDNNIDCNDYGDTFQWETVTHSDKNCYWYLDLGGHTIKNIQIAPNQAMFRFGNTANNSKISNGKILNVFANGSAGVCAYNGGLYGIATFKNISLSLNATGVLDSALKGTFDSCALYIEGGSSQQYLLDIPNNVSAKIKNTDIYLKNAKGFMLFYSVDSQNIIDSRIRGKFTGAQNYLANNGSVFNNCVIDLEFNGPYLLGNGGTNTGVINTDKLPSGFDTRGMTAVTSAEIINGDSLRAKDFVVVDVE